MHYVFEKDGMRTVVPCTQATRSRAQRAYRDYKWVEYDPKVLGITLASPRRQRLAKVEPQRAIEGDVTKYDDAKAIAAFLLILMLSAIAGGVEQGLIPFF